MTARLEHVAITNYRSFADASVTLRPFTLLVGANGSGKTNFLRLFRDLGRSKRSGFSLDDGWHPTDPGRLMPHLNGANEPTSIILRWSDGLTSKCDGASWTPAAPWPFDALQRFVIDPACVAGPEPVTPDAFVRGDGSGTIRVLDDLMTGEHRDLFDNLLTFMQEAIPGIADIRLKTVQNGAKALHVREEGLSVATPPQFLSDGTRILLALATAACQEVPPPILLIDDIDRALHPRLLENVVQFLRELIRKRGIQVIATTHNPYLVDLFQDEPEAVVVVEKVNHETTLTTLAERLNGLDYDSAAAGDMPLGNLWFSGFVGGVPGRPHGDG